MRLYEIIELLNKEDRHVVMKGEEIIYDNGGTPANSTELINHQHSSVKRIDVGCGIVYIHLEEGRLDVTNYIF